MDTDERRWDQEMIPQTANQKLELARKVTTMIFIISYLRSSASIRGSLPFFYGIPIKSLYRETLLIDTEMIRPKTPF